MKSSILVALLILPNISFAEDRDIETVCAEVGKITEYIMTSRQYENNLESLLEVVKGSRGASILAVESFKYPFYVTEEAKKIAIQNFKNQSVRDCYLYLREG